MEKTEELTFMIPENVTTRFEIVSGIGWKEILYMALVGALGLIVAAFIGINTVTVSKEVYVDDATVSDSIFQSNTGHYETVYEEESILSTGTRFLFFIFPAVVAYMLLKKNNSNQSMLDLFKSYYRFASRPKSFITRGDYYYDKLKETSENNKGRNNS